MGIFKTDYRPPAGFETETYSCFHTDPSFYESDYEAVMASKSELRTWSSSTWPEDSFTKEENREDLGLHESDNKDHSAWGYMLYNKEKTYCLGSLYVSPIDTLIENYDLLSGDAGLLPKLQARVDFWIRSGEALANLELTQKIADWLTNVWKIKAAYVLKEGMDQKKAAYLAAGLTEALQLKHREQGTIVFIFTR